MDYLGGLIGWSYRGLNVAGVTFHWVKTQSDIKNLQIQINRIEKILLICAGTLLAGMASVILMLLDKI